MTGSAQVDALLDVGCDIGQGFLLARPMSSADIVTYAAAYPATRIRTSLAPER